MKDLRVPLDEYHLMKKDAKFIWESRHEAFKKLKEVMSSNLVFTHPSKKSLVATNSSSYGKGGTIMHEFFGSLHPIMHFSSSLTAAEKNYLQI